MKQKCLYRKLYILLITLVVIGVALMSANSLSSVLHKDGLEIINIEEDTNTVYLAGGISTLKVYLDSVEGLTVGERVLVTPELQPFVDKAVIVIVILLSVVGIFYVLELFDVSTYIQMLKAKRGLVLHGEVTGFEHVLPLLYVVVVNVKSSKFRAKYPIFKFEMKKYPIGTPATVWNGGKRRTWVEIDTKRSS